MSRNPSGVYSLPPGSAAVDNTEIDPVVYNALLADLESDLNLARPIVAGGTGATSADAALTSLGGTVTGKAVFTAADVAAALVALGLTNTQVPTGKIGLFYLPAAPAGWLAASGQAVSRTTYSTLFAAIGTLAGAGDGSTTFNLPDLRGEFLRGLDSGRGVDTGRTLGSAQAAAMLNHTHSGTTSGQSLDHTHGSASGGNFVIQGAGGAINGIQSGGSFVGGWNVPGTRTGGASNDHTHTLTTGNPSAGGGTETRPRNVALLVCIKT
jgi:microcystin-dependent protein